MKKLLVASLLFIGLPVCAMHIKEKIGANVAGAFFMGYLIHEFLIKDPQVRFQEQQARQRLIFQNNFRRGAGPFRVNGKG